MLELARWTEMMVSGLNELHQPIGYDAGRHNIFWADDDLWKQVRLGVI